MKRIFIDGESGTTGLEIAQRLDTHPAIGCSFEILRLDRERRKDARARAEALNQCDLAILCLPDAAAREAAVLVENPATKVLDASTAHRTQAGWTYGFAEMDAGQRRRIAAASRVANPGCYATGAIAILRPLIAAGLVAPDYPASLFAVSGYSGGGKAMIRAFEDPDGPDRIDAGFYEYGLDFGHKHLPEIMAHGGLTRAPIFVPSVGRFPRGMLVNLPFRLDSLGSGVAARDLHACYCAHYAEAAESQVRVQPLVEGGHPPCPRLEADALAHTDRLDLHVFADAAGDRALVVASLDNLGKGACGAALQNAGLMLDLPELGRHEVSAQTQRATFRLRPR